MRAAGIIALALAATACNTEERAANRAREDAHDIARVEAAQSVTPPIAMLTPEPITFADIEKGKLSGASCAFIPPEEKSPIALAMAETAVLKTGGELHVYAADSGSAPLPLGSWTHYEGRQHVLDFQTAGGEGTPSGDETTDWPGRLTVRDPYDRVVYSAAGVIRCGA